MGHKDKRINEEIKSYTVNVIGIDWEKLWIMPTAKALQLAADANVDLVETWGMNEWVTIVKIMDYWKFLFKQQKNIAKSKSSSKRNEIKTLRLTYKMWDHDLEVRRNQAIKFQHECIKILKYTILSGLVDVALSLVALAFSPMALEANQAWPAIGAIIITGYTIFCLFYIGFKFHYIIKSTV